MPMTRPESAAAPPADAAAPGAELLVLLASPAAGGAPLRRAVDRLPPAAIPALLERLAWHRIDGLAHRALARLEGAAVDPWLLAALKRRARRCAAATLSQGLALAEILEAFDRRSIPVAVMRGLRMVESVYGDPGLRPFEDHDLLLPPADFEAARAILRRLGYDEPAAGYFRRGGVFVDLHTDPLGARRRPTRAAVFPLNAAPVLGRAVPGRVAGAPALLPEPEDELILLGVHLVKHSFDRLIRIADLAHFLAARGAALRPDVLVRRAAASRTLGLLCRAAEAAGHLGPPVPRFLTTPCVPPLERWLMRRVAALEPFPYTGEILMTLAAPGIGARARFLLDALLPAGETPADPWARTALFPRRAADLTRGALRQIAARKAGR
jgi:hypothetical protein